MTGRQPPNVLWLVADHVIHANHGSAVHDLPLQSFLGHRGVQFRRAYTPLPICSPARASMLTGLYPHAHGLTENDGRFGGRGSLDGSDWMIQSAFLQAGYRCAWFGKWHLDSASGATEFGFEGFSRPGYGYPYGTDEYLDYLTRFRLDRPVAEIEMPGESGIRTGTRVDLCNEAAWFDYESGTALLDGAAETHEAHFLASLAIDWLASNADSPFFLRLDPWGPHPPYIVPRCAALEPMPSNLSLSQNFDCDLASRPEHHTDYRNEWRDVLQLDRPGWQQMTHRAFQHAAIVEDAMMRVVTALTRLGQFENTLVIYTADHGDAVGSNGGMCNKGGLMVEETMRVPLVISGPSVEQGRTSDALVSSIDLAPTMVKQCELGAEDKLHGQELSPVLTNKTESIRAGLLTQHNGLHVHLPQRAYYQEDWKLIVQDDGFEELYHLKEDPAEMWNLAADPAHSEICSRLREGMKMSMLEVGDTFQVA